MSYDILTFKFLGVGVIDPQNVLDKRKKDVFLLNIIGAWKKSVIVLKEILAIICTIVKDLALSLIQLVIFIYL